MHQPKNSKVQGRFIGSDGKIYIQRPYEPLCKGQMRNYTGCGNCEKCFKESAAMGCSCPFCEATRNGVFKW